MQKHSPLTSTDFDGANHDIQGVRDKNPPKCPRKNPLEVIFPFIMAIIGISLECFVKNVTGFFFADTLGFFFADTLYYIQTPPYPLCGNCIQ